MRCKAPPHPLTRIPTTDSAVQGVSTGRLGRRRGGPCLILSNSHSRVQRYESLTPA
jgi:hypothetical protein